MNIINLPPPPPPHNPLASLATGFKQVLSLLRPTTPLPDRLGNCRGASQFLLIWWLVFGSRQVVRNFINSYLLSLFSYNKIIKTELFHPGCAVILDWTCCLTWKWILQMLQNFFWECDFLREHDKSDAFNWESVRKVVKWWDSWQSCVRLGKSWSVITNIQ